MKKYLCINSRYETKKITKNEYLPVKFFENLANGTTMYPEQFQQLKKSILKKKVLRDYFSDKKYIFENICVFDIRK